MPTSRPYCIDFDAVLGAQVQHGTLSSLISFRTFDTFKNSMQCALSVSITQRSIVWTDRVP